MKKDRLLDILRSWLGVHEPDHHFIIDKYNTYFDTYGHRPRGSAICRAVCPIDQYMPLSYSSYCCGSLYSPKPF